MEERDNETLHHEHPGSLRAYQDRHARPSGRPKDMVGWFPHHPYLRNVKQEVVTVGGVKGVQFDVAVEDPPKD
jgi:hypothetical protein